MKQAILILTLLYLSNSCPVASQTNSSEDALRHVLSEVGFSISDLGYRPAGYWNRFPLNTQHRLPSFDDLFAEPFMLIDFATVMTNAVEMYLDPAYTDSSEDGLYKLVYNLGVDKRLGGFRSYSANLCSAPESNRPLLDAIRELYNLAGRQTEVRTFGSSSELFDSTSAELAQIERLPDSVRLILGDLLFNLADAIKWRQLAFRNCNRRDMEKAFAIRDLADTQSDGQVYYPELDDLAATIDWASLHYSALKTAAAAEKAEHALSRHAGTIPDDFSLELPTPWGKLAIFSAKGAAKTSRERLASELPTQKKNYTEYDATNSLLIIDFGRNMIYQGAVGSNSGLDNPVSVTIDLAGDDYYGYNRTTYPPSAGVGLLGIGIVIDSDGDDHYNGSIYAQGAGLFGVGVLLDRAGDDEYHADLSAQGCGYFGIGLCFDVEGNDTYYLCGAGQGLGGVGGGVGVGASFAGDDKYTAEPFSEVCNRGDYHSDHKINGNEAQGAGFGRRGDGSDGHAWAGGLGAIIDIHGDDHYYSGNFSLGIGYWFATGIAVDRSGDDIYESCYFTQGSGAHFCNGILLDEAGDDKHELFETAGAGLGFGWDYTNAFLINIGGNDSYQAKMISMGLAQIRSNAFLIDIGGDDVYRLGAGTAGLGEASYRKGFDKPGRLTTYYSYAKSFGGFIDIGGKDDYVAFTDSTATPHPTAKDGELWLKPERADSTFGANNYGVGLDIAEGIIPELEKWTGEAGSN